MKESGVLVLLALAGLLVWTWPQAQARWPRATRWLVYSAAVIWLVRLVLSWLTSFFI